MDHPIDWEKVEFFKNAEFDLSGLENYFITKNFIQGEIIIDSNVKNSKLYILLSGHCTVNKGELVLHTIKPNHIFGEISSLLLLPVNADIQAKTDCSTLELDVQRMENDATAKSLLSNLKLLAGREVANKLNQSNQGYALKLKKENEDLKEKRRYSILFTQLFTGISIYTFCLDIIRRYESKLPSNTIISSIIILIFALLLLYLIIKSKLPLKSYGITLENWKSNLLYSFLYSLPILILAFIGKYCWMKYDTTGTVKLFQPEAVFTKPEDFNFTFYSVAIIAYCLLSIVQEFIGRCGIHATLRNYYLSDENPSEWKGIIVSSIMFMATHAHLGALFSALVFLPGVFWAWIFTKQNSIVGPAFSHCIIGVFIVFILGIPL